MKPYARHRPLRAQARHGDDRARPRRMSGKRALREEVERERVGLEAPAPVLERHLDRGLEHAAGRIGDDDVEAVEVLAELGEHLVDAVGDAHAALDGDRAPAQRADLAHSASAASALL